MTNASIWGWESAVDQQPLIAGEAHTATVAADRAAAEMELLARLRQNEAAAYEQLVRHYAPRMLAVALRFMRNESDANDAVQDAFVNVFRCIGSFQGGSCLGTWLHSIVVRACLMRLRSRRRIREQSIDDMLPRYHEPDGHRIAPGASWGGDPDALAQHRETRDTVRRCIDQLPETYRTVLMLRDIEELSTEEAARLLNVNAGVIKTRLHRARQALRTLLAPQLGGAL